MTDEKKLLAIALICALVGIFILLIISQRVEPKLLEISSVNKKLLDQNVKIQGTITSIRETPGLYILIVADNTSQITVTVLKEGTKPNENIPIIITGTVTEYKNQIQIQASEIKSV